MITYQLIKDITIFGVSTSSNIVIKKDNGISIASIPFDPANTDYQEFLRWCEQGNTPEPADE